MKDRVEILQQKLEQVKSKDILFQVFGASKHRYNLNPCLNESEIQEFEKWHNVTLPQDYRDFLLHLGNGGAGPGYGLWQLQDYWGLHLEAAGCDNFLSLAFPHTEAKQVDLETMELMSEKEFVEAVQGSIAIVHYGCAIIARLVVSGEEKGNIWIDDRASDGGIYPMIKPQTNLHVDFFTWYDSWLDKSLATFNGEL